RRHRRCGHRARVRRGVPQGRRHAPRRAPHHVPRRALVRTHPRGRRGIVKRVAALWALAGAAAALTVACAARSGGELPLPPDHETAILYVALGDSTVEGVGASGPETTYVGRLHAQLRGIYPNARVLNLGV